MNLYFKTNITETLLHCRRAQDIRMYFTYFYYLQSHTFDLSGIYTVGGVKFQ
jgi:hypothetical protein